MDELCRKREFSWTIERSWRRKNEPNWLIGGASYSELWSPGVKLLLIKVSPAARASIDENRIAQDPTSSTKDDASRSELKSKLPFRPARQESRAFGIIAHSTYVSSEMRVDWVVKSKAWS